MNFSPRLSAVWDPAADGRWSVSGSVARYVMALTSNLAGSTTAAGNAANYRWLYQGPAINAESVRDRSSIPPARCSSCLTGSTRMAAPTARPYLSATVPGFNMTMPEPLRSPVLDRIRGRGQPHARTAAHRCASTACFATTRIFTVNGPTSPPARLPTRPATSSIAPFVENTNDVRRRYAASSRRRLLPERRFALGATTRCRARTATSKARPPMRPQRRVDQPLPGIPPGGVELSGRRSLDRSATSRAGLGDVRRADGSRPDRSQSGSCSRSGPECRTARCADQPDGLHDQSRLRSAAGSDRVFLHCARRVPHRSDVSDRRLGELLVPPSRRVRELFFHGEVLNVFNQFQLCGCGDTVFNNGGLTNMTTIGQSVVLARRSIPTRRNRSGVNWDPHANFGTPLNTFAFTTPRLFRFSIGVRF